MASDLFGDGAGGVNVSGKIEAPWPRIAVRPSGASDLRDLAGGSIVTGVALEFVGPLDRSIGPAELWRRAMRVIREVHTFPDQPHSPGRPVMCDVRPSGITEQPLTSGQHRVTATVAVVIAPPQD
ncbi:MAG: hypothetical protein ACRCYR_03740 [Phycicoccus sp.]